MHRSNYSRVEAGEREAGERDLSIEAINKIAKHFHMTIDQLVNFEGDMPQEVTIEDKNTMEQMQLIQQLDEEDKNTVFKIIDKMLTTKKFKDFFNKNVAIL
jgi:arsenate reductase-like glutaredoxin family protein